MDSIEGLSIQANVVQKHGVVGIIFYTDPQDFTDVNATVYPESWWLPPSGVHRGSLILNDGDPLTPGYPSIGKHLYGFYEKHWASPKILIGDQNKLGE